MAPRERPRYLLIDALRGIAALAVVGFHAREGEHLAALEPHLPALVQGVLEYGHAGVAMFFVISGFAIANTMAYKHVTPGYVGRFLARRSVRLDPPYWASMALVILMGVLSTHVVADKIYRLPSWTDILVHMTYLTELLEWPQISDVYWTLCMEVQFYLTFSLLLMGATWLEPRLGKERALDAVLWPSVAASNLWVLGLFVGTTPGLFVHFWFLFLLGVLVWRAVVRAQDRDFAPTIVAVVQIGFLAVIGIAQQDPPIIVAVFTATLVLATGLTGRLQTWLSQRPLQFLGVVSYSLYLTHNQVTGAVFRLGYRLTGRTPLWEAFWFAVVLATCLGVAWVFFRLFEAPSMALSKKIRIPDPANIPPPVAAPALVRS